MLDILYSILVYCFAFLFYVGAFIGIAWVFLALIGSAWDAARGKYLRGPFG